MKIALAFVIALLIGAGCRWFEVPIPAPPKMLGALLILAITLGYLGTDWLLTRGGAATPDAPAAAASNPTPPAADRRG